jgi:hypothetical protein
VFITSSCDYDSYIDAVSLGNLDSPCTAVGSIGLSDKIG